MRQGATSVNFLLAYIPCRLSRSWQVASTHDKFLCGFWTAEHGKSASDAALIDWLRKDSPGLAPSQLQHQALKTAKKAKNAKKVLGKGKKRHKGQDLREGGS